MRFLMIGCLTASVFAGAANAHGPQLQITNDGGKIVTRSVLINDYSILSPARNAYALPVGEVMDLDFPTAWRAAPSSDPAYPFGPGLAYGLGATFPGVSTLTVSFLNELERWDGGAYVSAGPVELAMLRTSNPNADSLTGNAGVSGGPDAEADAAIAVSYDAGAHASITWVLLGDGVDPAAEVADGLYRATLQLSSSDPSIAASDPYYLLLSKNAAEQVAPAAVFMGLSGSALQNLTVPEPTGVTLVAAGMLCLLARRRR